METLMIDPVNDGHSRSDAHDGPSDLRSPSVNRRQLMKLAGVAAAARYRSEPPHRRRPAPAPPPDTAGCRPGKLGIGRAGRVGKAHDRLYAVP